MAVYDGNGIGIRYGHMIRLHSDELAMLFVQLVDRVVSPAAATLIHIPEVGEFGEKRAGDILDRPIAQVREEVVEDRSSQQQPWSKEEGEKHGDCKATTVGVEGEVEQGAILIASRARCRDDGQSNSYW